MDKIDLKIPSIPKKFYIGLSILVLTFLVFSSGFLGGKFFEKKTIDKNDDKYIVFIDEVYNKIQENYWDKISDKDLSNLFKLAAEKINGIPETLKSNDKKGVELLIEKSIKNKDDSKKKEFVAQISDIVLVNLKPFGISRLYTTKEEQKLTNTVNNVDPSVDLYQTLGIAKTASEKEIEKVYTEKISELSKKETPESQEQISQINRAFETLSNSESRKNYDNLGIEKIITSSVLNTDTLLLKIKIISPAVFEEFQKTITGFNNNLKLNYLVLDLRDNIGGSVDVLPAFLGLFIGNNQYAFDFFRQGENIPFKTTTSKFSDLARFKKTIILINNNTQSSAEIITSTLKKYNIAIIVGTTTKGWGTIKRVFQIDNQIDQNEKYSMFIAHSLVLRDDGQTQEGLGVEPNIDINKSTWQKQLFNLVESNNLVQTIRDLVK